MDDYVHDPYPSNNFGAIPYAGGFVGRWVKYNHFLFMPFWGNSPTSQTECQIFMHVDSCKDVPFWGYWLIELHI